MFRNTLYGCPISMPQSNSVDDKAPIQYLIITQDLRMVVGEIVGDGDGAGDGKPENASRK